MKNFLFFIVSVSVLVVSSAALATTFDYSYTFSPGDTITGSFTGNVSVANNDLITNLSNITCYINGTAIAGSGSLLSASYNGSSFSSGAIANPAVVSFDGLQSNFLFINASQFPLSSYPSTANFTNYFYIIPWTNGNQTTATQFYSSTPIPGTVLTSGPPAANYYGGGGSGYPGYYEYLYNGTYNAANWHVSATPIPPAAWLLGSGLLGLVGIKRRMRRD